MVQIRSSIPRQNDGSIDIDAWLKHIEEIRGKEGIRLIRHAYLLGQLAGKDYTTFTGESCLQTGLAMAEILLDLNLDHQSIAAAIVYNSLQFAELTLEDISEHLGDDVSKLVQGVEQMDAIHTLPTYSHNRSQMDNVRKMLLAMASDIRVVLIKLAERLCILRSIKTATERQRALFTRETLEIYAPLANRLGLGHLKWEMEDLSFRFSEPVTYKQLARQLQEKRIDREDYVHRIIADLEKNLLDEEIANASVTGRAKHIYSIYRKMKRKSVSFDEIYDTTAVRVLVEEITDCYRVLSAVHTKWQNIPEEFDDYIATPKENGYQSIHTAVYGPENKIIEVQIRTYQMHEESEMGVAAHWKYKEGNQQKSTYEEKITWLRQIIEWQKEVIHTDDEAKQIQTQLIEDRVYATSPKGDIIDLPSGSTALDFAYHIHSEIGHRCRGAKVNDKIVNLSYQLKTGDRVEILTAKQPNPSRDWLNPHSGYLKSTRARAKLHHWFKQQDYDLNLTEGEDLLKTELSKSRLKLVKLLPIANKLNYKNVKDLYASLGAGDVRLNHLINLIKQAQPKEQAAVESEELSISSTEAKGKSLSSDIHIEGVDNLLTHLSKCCKPLPGDNIIGYITKGRGISIHRSDCINIANLKQHQDKLVDVSWGLDTSKTYPIDIWILAHERQNLIRDITAVLADEKLPMLAINSRTNHAQNSTAIKVTVEITSHNRLQSLLRRLEQITSVTGVQRGVK